MALDRACNHEEACTFNSRTRAWLAGRDVTRPRSARLRTRKATHPGLCSAGCVPGGRVNGRLDSEHGRCVSRCSRPLITTMAITRHRSTEAVTARSTGTAATPPLLATTPPVTPFNTFLNTRGAQFTTPGLGLSPGAASGGPRQPVNSSTIRPTAPSSAPSARRGCSLQWAATSPKLCSSCPAPMG